MRIGIVGVENSHVNHIIAALNVEQLAADTAVTALAGPDDARTAGLLETGDIKHRVDTVEELLEHADALVVSDRHGDLHREHALPFLTAGRPVYVDKPLACSVADARAMLDAAREHGALLTSSSTMRWVPELADLESRLGEIGELQTVITTGAADPDSEYGGIFFYGIHAVDVALRLAGGPISDVRTERTGNAVLISLRAGGTAVRVNLVRADADGQVPFHAVEIGRHGLLGSALSTAGNYVWPALAGFLEMVSTGKAPIEDTDLLRPIEVLAQVAQQLDGQA